MNKDFYEKVNQDLLGYLPGYFDSRKLLYEIILESKNVPNSLHVEIGTLCGGGTIFMLKALEDKGALETEMVACIDPFTGFYDKEDFIVSIDTVKKNVSHFGYDPDKIIFFPTLSSDKNTIKRLSRYLINTVFIDGDHKYESVKNDWQNYSRLLMPTGYIIFDDYVGEDNGRPKGNLNLHWRATSWGQVSRFVDSVLMPNLKFNKFQFVKKSQNAVAFRKLSKQNLIGKLFNSL